jgi:hypothetical protein
MQHFRVRIFTKPGTRPDLGAAIPVFHRWIQQKKLPEFLIDVADYRHVPLGPGVMLIGHDAHYSLSESGLLYNRRTEMDGSVQDRILSAVNAAKAAAELLEAEAEFKGSLAFVMDELEISVNDRALAPNNEATWNALKPEIQGATSSIWGTDTVKLERTGEPRDLFTVKIILR